MEILKVTVKIKWNKPANGELPEKYGEYYVVDNYNQHRIMKFIPEGGWGGMNWDGGYGSNSMKSNKDIKYWTELLPVLYN